MLRSKVQEVPNHPSEIVSEDKNMQMDGLTQILYNKGDDNRCSGNMSIYTNPVIPLVESCDLLQVRLFGRLDRGPLDSVLICP